MRFDRRQFRGLCSSLVVVLLFAQIATAAYACPRVAADMPVAVKGMPGCDGHMAGTMDSEQPQLCKAHCEQGQQTVNGQPTQDLATAPLLLSVLDWSAATLAQLPALRLQTHAPSGAPPPGSPPLYLALLVLRN